MTKESRVALTVLLGAIGGGLCGYLFLTERGSRLRAELEPTLKDIIADVRSLGATVEEAMTTASEGWDAIGRLVADERGQGAASDAETRH